MEKMKFMTVALACGMFMLTSCDKNNDDGLINNEIYTAFEREFPGATNVSWTTNGSYAIASFNWDGSRAGNNADYTAWFEKSTAEFMMHEYDIVFSALPQTVLSTFNASDYSKAPWTREDEVDVIKRKGEELTLYVIEVEKKENGSETEADLYYTEDGILVKEVLDADREADFTELLPMKPADDVYSWIESKYPGAKIIDMDFDDGGVELEFVYDNAKYEALLSSKYEWIYSKRDYNRNSSVLPVKAMDYISANYSDYFIEDIEYYETASKGNFFCVEVENRNDDDLELYFDDSGNRISSIPGFVD